VEGGQKGNQCMIFLWSHLAVLKYFRRLCTFGAMFFAVFHWMDRAPLNWDQQELKIKKKKKKLLKQQNS